jgi:ABC-type lipoprotein export system ATPase subunit
MINLRNIEKAFAYGPAKTYVLRRIDLDIKPGEFVSIMGPSGAGKSTLLHILGMHDQSWSGEYYFNDVPVARQQETRSVAESEHRIRISELSPPRRSNGI